MNDVANPPDIEADDSDRDDETMDLDMDIYEGEPEFASSGTEDDTATGYQDDGDLS